MKELEIRCRCAMNNPCEEHRADHQAAVMASISGGYHFCPCCWTATCFVDEED